MPLLRAFELPFVYEEAGERKEALVKVKLCPKCQAKLTWKPGKESASGTESEAEISETAPARKNGDRHRTDEFRHRNGDDRERDTRGKPASILPEGQT